MARNETKRNETHTHHHRVSLALLLAIKNRLQMALHERIGEPSLGLSDCLSVCVCENAANTDKRTSSTSSSSSFFRSFVSPLRWWNELFHPSREERREVVAAAAAAAFLSFPFLTFLFFLSSYWRHIGRVCVCVCAHSDPIFIPLNHPPTPHPLDSTRLHMCAPAAATTTAAASSTFLALYCTLLHLPPPLCFLGGRPCHDCGSCSVFSTRNIVATND